MKNVLIYIILLCLGYTIVYLLISFVIMDLNVSQWSEGNRVTLVIFGTPVSALLFAIRFIDYLNKPCTDKQKDKLYHIDDNDIVPM